MPEGTISHRRVARHTLWNLAGYVLPLFVALAALPATVRLLGAERYGLLALVLLAHDYVGYFDFGLGRAATRALADVLNDPARRQQSRSVLLTCVVLHLGLGAVLAVLFAALVPLAAPILLRGSEGVIAEGTSSLMMAALFGPVLLLMIAARGALEALQRFDLVNAIKVPSNAVTYLIPFVGGLWSLPLPTIVLLLVLSRLLTGLLYWWMAHQRLPSGTSGRFDWPLGRSLVSFGGLIMAANLAGLLLVDGDRLLVSALASIEWLTYYSIPQDVTTRLWIIPASVASALFPVFAIAAPGMSAKVGKLYADSTLYMLLLFVPAVLVTTVFGRELLEVWMGERFAADSALVLQVIMFGVMLDGLARVPLTYLQATGYPGLPARIRWWLVAPFLLASGWAITRAGIAGAAAVWSLRIAVEAALLFYLTERRGLLVLPRSGWTRLGRGAAAAGIVLGTGCIMEAFWRPTRGVEFALVALLLAAFLSYSWIALVDRNHRAQLRIMFHRTGQV